MHTRSLFSVWLCLLPVLFSSLTAELLRPFRTSYLFLGAWIVGGLSYLLFRLYCSVYEKAKGFRPLRYLIPIWFLLTLFFTVLIIENFGTRIVHSLMLHSDARFYNVTLILAAAILSSKGIKPLGRMAEILLPVFSAAILIITPFVLFGTPDALITPIPARAWADSMIPGAAVSVFLAAGGVLFFCGETIEITAHSKKQCAYAALMATVYALLIPLLTVKLSGRFLAEQTSTTFFLALRQFEPFPNAHILFAVLWILLTLVLCGVFFWSLQKLLHRMFPKISETLFVWVVPLLVTVVLGIRNEVTADFSLALWFVVMIGLPLYFGTPVIINRRNPKPPSANR